MTKVVVDASLALRWVLKDEKEPSADALLQQWIVSSIEILVPPLFLAEITNALYLSFKRKRLTLDEAGLALRSILELGIQVAEPPRLYLQSLQVAAEYSLTNAYDAQYVALAQIEDCQLWTADERLVSNIQPSPSWLKLV
ncbi:MAG: type II toxin-antitoxin system VapC family toxin [Chloroflexi bacterium]|nr:type II toxin-antitoxin system VapC family toxin [Chloroflexota bacterium]